MSYSLLLEHLLRPVASVVRQRLAACFYHDIFGIEALTTNKQGIDIVAQQVELQFENGQTVFVGWNGVKEWFPYTLCASATSFCSASEKFTPRAAYWQQLAGRQLTDFDVFGFPDTRPHLLLLNFEGLEVAIGNCYLERDFIPQDPMGDDVWILLNAESIQQFIKKLDLKKLEV
ncbi:hypothetical protein [Hymenobacter actinosclerus]|uniref:Uncharacterized protein n=1 Tax=Hymenobacter actinosclerus TaxID=82805 RepID=A0A1I0BVJ5_9BACT|nr:hypothetical protein [Hymenobacter actinosclerus]SET10819.1 hypothetical protein SAMN04487998_1204 [Hymenobacter actinosclerus]